MAGTSLSTYVNDHMAGTVVALELIEHLENVHVGDPVGSFAVELKADILADRGELERLMSRQNITASRPRMAAGWLAEKATALKLRVDDPAGGALRLLEVLEALSVGIEGKRLLWRSLSAATVQGLTAADYQRLEQRAEEQRGRVEAMRLEAAKSALATA
jgi:hypothetical protein